MYLTQRGHSTGSNWFVWAGVKRGFAAGTWKDQARNLRPALDNR